MPRDALDPGRGAEFVQHACRPRKAAGFGDDHAVQRQGLGSQRDLQHVPGRLPQPLGEARRLEQCRVERRRPALDQPPHHRLEQHLLAAEAVIERALRDAGAFRDGLDAGRAKAVVEKQRRRDIEDAVRQLRRFKPRRPAVMAARPIPGAWFRLH